MKKTTPPLGWLRTFECAGRHLSFTLAADELRMTQSAVSQQIRSLEARLDCLLFVRKHRSIVLTDEGRRLLPDVSQAINQLYTATAKLDQVHSADLLNVATSVSVAQWYLVPLLSRFIEQHPHVKVRLMTTVWPDEISHANADVLIRFGSKDDNPYVEKQLGKNRLVLVASPQFIKSRRIRQLNAKNIVRYPLIQAVGTSDTWANCARQFGFDEELPVTINVDSHGLAVDFAQAGSGIALTSQLIAQPALTAGKLKLIHSKTIRAVDGYFISIKPGSNNSTARAFVGWLLQQVEL